MNFRLIPIFFLILLLNGKAAAQKGTQICLHLEQDIDSIESVTIFDLQQVRSYYQIPFTNGICFDFPFENHQLYFINYNLPANRKFEQFWTGSGRVDLFLSIESPFFKLDSIIDDGTNKQVEDYFQLVTSNPERRTEEFYLELCSHFKAFQQSPFVFLIADEIRMRYSNDSKKILELKQKLKGLPLKLRNDPAFESTFSSVCSLLENKRLDLSMFRFYDESLKSAAIVPPKNGFLVLDFWFTNCKPCLKDHQKIKIVYERLFDRQNKIVGISVDSAHVKWQEFIFKNVHPWRDLVEDYEFDETLSSYLEIDIFPTYLVLNTDLEIIKVFHSFDLVKDFIENPF